MAGRHRRADAAITITTALPSEQLATLCKDAADQSKARLDDAKPGELTFSFRGAVAPERIHLMTFKVKLVETDGKRRLVSRISHYKTRQSKFLLLIPAGPKRMLALSGYERFMARLGDLASQADPDSTVAIEG